MSICCIIFIIRIVKLTNKEWLFDYVALSESFTQLLSRHRFILQWNIILKVYRRRNGTFVHHARNALRNKIQWIRSICYLKCANSSHWIDQTIQLKRRCITADKTSALNSYAHPLPEKLYCSAMLWISANYCTIYSADQIFLQKKKWKMGTILVKKYKEKLKLFPYIDLREKKLREHFTIKMII